MYDRVLTTEVILSTRYDSFSGPGTMVIEFGVSIAKFVSHPMAIRVFQCSGM